RPGLRDGPGGSSSGLSGDPMIFYLLLGQKKPFSFCFVKIGANLTLTPRARLGLWGGSTGSSRVRSTLVPWDLLMGGSWGVIWFLFKENRSRWNFGPYGPLGHFGSPWEGQGGVWRSWCHGHY